MHPDTREIATDWRHTIFAVSDPLVYIQIQLRQFEFSTVPLPLVLWQDSPNGKAYVRTRLAWGMFRDCRVVFWDLGLSLTTLRQAIAINGWIATCGPRRSNDAEELRDYLERCVPATFCSQLQKRAMPWPKALAVAMRKWSDSLIEDRFLQLQLEAPQLERVRKACPYELRARLDSILQSRRIRGNVYFGDYDIIEQDDGWYCCRRRGLERQQTLICNAKLRLSQVVTYKHSSRMFYAGTIIFNNEEIPFTAPYREMERNPFKWLQQFLLQQNKGVLHYNPSWKNRFLRVATLFKEPQIIQGLDVVGWDHDKVEFILPGHSIGLDGGVRKLPVCEDVSTLPAANLRYSSDPPPTNWHELGDAVHDGPVLGDAGRRPAQRAGAALLRETRAVGLVGKGAQKMGMAVAQAAGCLVQEIRGIKSVRAAIEVERAHRWAVCAPIASEVWRPAFSTWIKGDQTCPRNCITGPIDKDTAAELEGSGRWSFVIGMEPIPLSWEIEKWPLVKAVRRLVPQYLANVCRRRLKVEDVLEDLAGFIVRSGGTIDVEKVRGCFGMAETKWGRRYGRSCNGHADGRGETGAYAKFKSNKSRTQRGDNQSCLHPRHAAEACRKSTMGDGVAHKG